MRRKFLLLGIAVVVLALVASTVSLAGSRGHTPNFPHPGLREMYDRSAILTRGEGPVQMPRPVGSGDQVASLAETPTPGPIAMSMESPDPLSSVFAAPRGGGSMYSAEQKADREIRRLIRRLN